MNATGICHSDIHFMLNDWALPKMSALGTRCAGHEGAGVIVKVGADVERNGTLKVGMRAGYKPIQDTWYVLFPQPPRVVEMCCRVGFKETAGDGR